MTRWERILTRHARVVVVGQSNAGKTTLCSQADGRHVWNVGVQGIDGDTPADVGFGGNPYHWLDRIQNDPGPWIIEGTGCFRILRVGIRDRGWEPDVVVFVEASHEPDEIPDTELPGNEADAERVRLRALGRAAGHQTVWDAYRALCEERGSMIRVIAGTLEWFRSEGED